MQPIFISYSRKDKVLADEFVRELKTYGLSVWYDEYIDGEKAFQDEILKKLQESALVIVLWSKSSVKSRYVIDETNFAADKNKLLSISIDNISEKDIPIGMRGKNIIKYKQKEKILTSIAEYGIYINHSKIAILNETLYVTPIFYCFVTVIIFAAYNSTSIYIKIPLLLLIIPIAITASVSNPTLNNTEKSSSITGFSVLGAIFVYLDSYASGVYAFFTNGMILLLSFIMFAELGKINHSVFDLKNIFNWERSPRDSYTMNYIMGNTLFSMFIGYSADNLIIKWCSLIIWLMYIINIHSEARNRALSFFRLLEEDSHFQASKNDKLYYYFILAFYGIPMTLSFYVFLFSEELANTATSGIIVLVLSTLYALKWSNLRANIFKFTL
jgi:hypothetical protein